MESYVLKSVALREALANAISYIKYDVGENLEDTVKTLENFLLKIQERETETHGTWLKDQYDERGYIAQAMKDANSSDHGA